MEYKELREREFQTTLRVLQAYPEDKLGLRPSDKSRTAAELALIMVIEERVIKTLIQTGATSPSTHALETPSTMAEIVSAWKEAVSVNDSLLSALSGDDLTKPVNFYGMHLSMGNALWLELLDHIHHRGQFSVYLRLAGAKVPSIYGPTADEPMG